MLVFLIVAFFIANVFCGSDNVAKASTASDLKDKIANLQKKEKEAQAELTVQQSQLYKNKTQIGSTQSSIQKLQADIARSELELQNLDERAEFNKKMLAEYIRQVYYADQEDPIVSLAIFQGNLDDLTMNFDSMVNIKAKIVDALEVINDAKTETEQAKFDLSDQKQDNQELLQTQQVKQSQITDDIEATQATLAEIQKKMSELQGDLNKLLGKSYNTKDIKDAIKYASNKTGIRAGFLFGMLSVESRLGASTGSCTAAQSRMSSYRLGLFKQITKSLGYDYTKKKVSCPPSGYKGTGGAMGVAQFMSDTWTGYKSSIASATGNNPPDPWSLSDGVMAMAIKLKNDGGAKDGKTTITSPCNKKKVSVKWEVYASMRYLGWSCYALNNYSKTIQSLSGNYDQL